VVHIRLGRLALARLIDVADGFFIGIVLGAASPTERIEGDDADKVWVSFTMRRAPKTRSRPEQSPQLLIDWAGAYCLSSDVQESWACLPRA